jgi:hypothetical protein
MFAAAKDVSAGTIEAEPPSETAGPDGDEDISYKQEHTPKTILDGIRKEAIAALAAREGVSLIAHKRAQFWSGDKTVRAVCPVSKRYRTGYYWYAFHLHQRSFIAEAQKGYLLLGCLDSDVTYALPSKVIEDLVTHLNATEIEDRIYWHIHLQPSDDLGYQLLIPKRDQKLSMKQFEIKVAGK